MRQENLQGDLLLINIHLNLLGVYNIKTDQMNLGLPELHTKHAPS